MAHARTDKSKKKKIDKMKFKKNLKKICQGQMKRKLKNADEDTLNNVLHQNQLLKNALKYKRHFKRNLVTSNKFCTLGQKLYPSTKQQNTLYAKQRLWDFFLSYPVTFGESNIITCKDTKLHGVFGKISLVTVANLPEMYLVKKEVSLKKSKQIDVIAEAKVMHALSGHILFPYCFGFVRPNILISQFVGEIDDNGNISTQTISKMMFLESICKHGWLLICNQVLDGIKFMHDLNILHNDIKADNIVLYGPRASKVKIVDFGKCTLVTDPVTYNLSSAESAKYNERHRYLAHELRNLPLCKQNKLTDVYSIGYMFKHIGHYQKFDFLYSIGRKMKNVDCIGKLTLDEALLEFKNILISFTFK